MAEKHPEEQAAELQVPTCYANGVQFQISPYDMIWTFSLNTASGPPQPQTRVMMSLEHAVVATMILRRVLREYYKSSGASVQIHPTVLKDQQLDEEEPLWK